MIGCHVYGAFGEGYLVEVDGVNCMKKEYRRGVLRTWSSMMKDKESLAVDSATVKDVKKTTLPSIKRASKSG